MGCALAGYLRASPSGPPGQAPCGVGCLHRPSREHGRPALRLRVWPFPATIDPAGTTAAADCSAASRSLSAATVPHHPAIRTGGASRTPAEPSEGKTSNLHRTPTAFTKRPLDGIGLRRSVQARPDRPAFYAQRTVAHTPCVPRVAASSPASSPRRLTTTQLPSTCGWCHQPPRGTRTPELLVTPRAHRACGSPAPGFPTSFSARHARSCNALFR
jgi:hypothetical protein